MNENRTDTLILRDQDGTYYELTPELMVEARVPAEQQAALERQLAGADASGFAMTLFTTLPTPTGSVWGVSSGTEVSASGPGLVSRQQ